MENCPFCNLKKDYRTVYEDEDCFVSLEEEQSIKGYILVVPKKHYHTILDQSIKDDELIKFWRIVQKVGNALKRFGAENVYVCSMCDGLKHFHVHLIPRYTWTDENKKRYAELFTERDGTESVKKCIERGLIGGYWWLADSEKNYNKTSFMQLPIETRHSLLSALARSLCKLMK